MIITDMFLKPVQTQTHAYLNTALTENPSKLLAELCLHWSWYGL